MSDVQLCNVKCLFSVRVVSHCNYFARKTSRSNHTLLVKFDISGTETILKLCEYADGTCMVLLRKLVENLKLTLKNVANDRININETNAMLLKNDRTTHIDIRIYSYITLTQTNCKTLLLGLDRKHIRLSK